MVLTPFAWCYGGHQVSLYGSFNGWAERVPMILVEGSSTIFQTVVDLPPGNHRYKFLVDGVWHFDEQKLCTRDEYGTISNIIFIEEQEFLSPTLHSDAIQQSMAQASSLGALHHEQVLHFSDGEIHVSLRRLSMHLSSSKTYDLIPYSGKVIALDVEVAVNQAFHVMHKEGLGVVPLWDERSTQVSGMLTASDFILILLELHKNSGVLTDEQLQVPTISAWKGGKFNSRREACGTALPLCRKPLVQAGPDESLRDVALRILQNKISSVPILQSAREGSCQQLLHIACLAGILRYICRHFRDRPEYLPLLQRSIGSLPLIRETGRVLTLRTNDSLSSALKLLIEAQISSIPIVDDDGSLLDVYSRSDIMSLARDNLYAQIKLDQMVMSEALKLVNLGIGNRYQTCTRSDSLFRVMELLTDPVVRRLIVTEPGSQRIQGLITLRDVFNYILT